ncbi:MAG: PTS sugar transporter subunit IIA [Fusobacteriaceae bacterium]
MGFLNIFKKKDVWFEVYSPLNGKVIDLLDVPDEAFVQKMIGDGCAIEPSEGIICAPVSADIDIFETNHAISFEVPNGLEMIVHFGVNTVQLRGEGFKRIAESGSTVKVGDELVKYDLSYLKENALSVKTPVLINNMDMVEKIEIVAHGNVKVGDLLMRIKLAK